MSEACRWRSPSLSDVLLTFGLDWEVQSVKIYQLQA